MAANNLGVPHTPQAKANIAKAMKQVQTERSELVAEARAARAAKAAQRADAHEKALTIIEEVTCGKITMAEALPRAESAVFLLRMTKAEEDDLRLFDMFVSQLRAAAQATTPAPASTEEARAGEGVPE